LPQYGTPEHYLEHIAQVRSAPRQFHARHPLDSWPPGNKKGPAENTRPAVVTPPEDAGRSPFLCLTAA
jgi:hypothetical protein